MNLDGTVADLNQGIGMIAVKTADAGFAIFEAISGCELQIGDRVRWNEWRNELVNVTSGDRTVAVLQGFGAGPVELGVKLHRS